VDQMAALSSLYGVQLASYVKHASPQNTLRTFSMRWVTHAYVLYRVSQRLKGKPELRPAEIPPLHERVTPWQNEVDYFLAPRYNAERLARFASWGYEVAQAIEEGGRLEASFDIRRRTAEVTSELAERLKADTSFAGTQTTGEFDVPAHLAGMIDFVPWQLAVVDAMAGLSERLLQEWDKATRLEPNCLRETAVALSRIVIILCGFSGMPDEWLREETEKLSALL